MSKKPSRVNTIASLFAERDSIEYIIEERLRWAPRSDSLLSKKRLVFILDRNAVSPGFPLTMKIFQIGTNKLLEEQHLLMEDTEFGAKLKFGASSLGPQFFPLRLMPENADDSLYFQSLPQMLSLAQRWESSNGIFQIEREVVDLDTLDLGENLEEVWKIEEKTYHEKEELLSSFLWYGQSGLVRVEQEWGDIEVRDASGSLRGKGSFLRTLTQL